MNRVSLCATTCMSLSSGLCRHELDLLPNLWGEPLRRDSVCTEQGGWVYEKYMRSSRVLGRGRVGKSVKYMKHDEGDNKGETRMVEERTRHATQMKE